jgi:hypothetical protein
VSEVVIERLKGELREGNEAVAEIGDKIVGIQTMSTQLALENAHLTHSLNATETKI